MRISHFFIDHPIFAAILSMFITIVGGVAYFTLPVSQYPSIAPPIVQVTATYPGASAEVVSQTVATPIEQQINGVEDMLYMSSQATSDGKLVISVTFKLGTNLDTAQVLTQNRVAVALPVRLHEIPGLGRLSVFHCTLIRIGRLLSPEFAAISGRTPTLVRSGQ